MTSVSKLARLISCGTWRRCWATGLNTIPKLPNGQDASRPGVVLIVG